MNPTIERIKTIAAFHKLRGLPLPDHPLISVVDYALVQRPANIGERNLVFDFYQISIKTGMNATFRYGQQAYDFDDGVMFFAAPNQVFSIKPDENATEKRSGWILLIHPDFFYNTSLAKSIRQYDFFGYAVNEALWLSKKEETTIHTIIQNIRQEYHSNIDKFSKQIIVAQVEGLLSYAERFYNRQFLTREKSGHQILERLETLLTDYFDADDVMVKGLPTVQYIAAQLNVSPKYLGGLLKVLTGQSTQQHIHEKLIAKAKEALSATRLSVSGNSVCPGF